MKKAQISIYFVYMIFAIIIVVIAAIFAPIGVLMNSELYQAGEDILNDANESIQSIQDTSIKNSVNAVVASAKNSAENNININANLFQYGWILVIGLTALVIFLFTRRLVEYGAGGFI